MKEVAAHVRKYSPWGAVGATVQSAGLRTVSIPHGKDFLSGADHKIIITIQHYGSGENTGENDRVSRRQVQQESVHGRSLRTTSGKFGSAGNEVQLRNTPQHVR